MRILFMADTLPDPNSGAAGTEFQTVRALREIGHEVDTVWADALPRRIRHGNAHYLLELPFAYRTRMLERLQVKPYDVVHVNQPHGYLAARSLRSRPDRRPVFVHRSHGFEPRVAAVLTHWEQRLTPKPVLRRVASRAMQRMLEFNYRGIARYADGHIVSASLCAEYLGAHYGVPRPRIGLIAQAAPAEALNRRCHDLDPARLGRILYVSQFTMAKAPSIVAQAFEQLLLLRPQAKLTWVCDARHHSEARSLLGPLGRERTDFLGWMPQTELMHIYDTHGVFLFPSFFEGFGKVFLEAMARGLVVVASAEGGARDLIVHGHNGFLAAPGNARATAAACASAQADPQWAAHIGAAARVTALDHTWERVATETTAFYQQLMEMQ